MPTPGARAFGAAPKERDPLAYWPIDRWEVDRLDDVRRAHFRRHFDETFWTSVPAIEGAVEACHRLHDAGFDLVCVSALEAEFESARLRNLRDLGFPIERVIATGNAAGERSPKADAITELEPGGVRRRLPALHARRCRGTSTPRWCCAPPTAARTSAKRCRCWPARSTPTCPTSPATGWRAEPRYLRWLSSEVGGV